MELLDYKHIKLYKIGLRKATIILNEFEVGIGTTKGILGFSKRGYILPIPVTAIQRPLTDYVFEQKNVIAPLRKGRDDNYYSEVVGCINRGIECELLPAGVRSKIAPQIQIIKM